ncbi:hypothetical protein SAMN05444920_1195 [Nonomuraea solani]|uniref:Uncharacterized protein n=1 Tax=Nonomuraea solani TaxID=1144553 RepID=A0A1H6EVX9_9ACTN|nr:hypothetical protein [Nonomuraea solani]SEH01075.1 hypothetical protein SAMN05444920_1195 [Nonomuraea solani]
MTAPLTVTLAGDADRPALHATLASLPQDFRPVATGGDVLAVAGLDALTKALADRPRGILLTGVTTGAPGRVHDLADRAAEAGVPVVVAATWALNPALTAATGTLRRDLGQAALVELTATVPPGLPVLVDQLALLRTALGPATALELLQSDDHGHTAHARAGDVPVHLAAAVSPWGPARARLSLLGPAAQWRVSFPDPATASPADVVRSDADGEHRLPALYENAARASWRALHAAVTEGAAPPYRLHDLADDLRLLL